MSTTISACLARSRTLYTRHKGSSIARNTSRGPLQWSSEMSRASLLRTALGGVFSELADHTVPGTSGWTSQRLRGIPPTAGQRLGSHSRTRGLATTKALTMRATISLTIRPGSGPCSSTCSTLWDIASACRKTIPPEALFLTVSYRSGFRAVLLTQPEGLQRSGVRTLGPISADVEAPNGRLIAWVAREQIPFTRSLDLRAHTSIPSANVSQLNGP
jgi:hypothetical protein